MDDTIDISEVIRRTGLTARALRFYEGRGLVAPLRTASGRRLYGRAELARLDAIVTLKAAGFALAEIGRMLGTGRIDMGALIAARLDALDLQATRLADARRLLATAKSRIDRGEPLDAATLCSLIRHGDRTMDQDRWKTVAGRHFSPEEQARWAERAAALPADFDQAAYAARWADLGTRIGGALPLDPGSEQAEAFVREWFALLEPFAAVATPEMWQGATRLHQARSEWEGQADPGFSADIWAFIQEAAARMKAAGKVVGPLPVAAG